MRLQSLHLDVARFRHLDLMVGLAGLGYMLAAAWAMQNVSYDIWGAFVAAPLIAAVMIPIIHATFRRQPALRRIAYAGLAAKGLGTLARYWVAFDAYGGAADAQAYHDKGRLIAGQIRGGEVALWSLIPHGQGTRFLESLNGTLYTLVGSSKLAGFMWFSALGFGGVLLCIKAACLAAPKASLERYALLCCLSPSLVFWPSSLGKESWMSLSFGLLAYGSARLFSTRQFVRPLTYVAAGTAGGVFVRPHIAAVWVGAAVTAAVWSAVGTRTDRSNSRATAAVVMAIGVAGLVLVGRIALQFLGENETSDSVGSQIDNAFDRTLRRTSGGGSQFVPSAIESPLDYPLSVLRTLTRPLPHEVTGISTLLPALETTAIIVLAVVGARRLASLPGMLRRSPFTVFHLLVVVTGALAYSSFSNLAILVRQRSLLMPSLLFLLCLPPYVRPEPTMSAVHGRDDTRAPAIAAPRQQRGRVNA
ncbi:MAG: hypothetical protein Q7V88_08500 [Actinomycetota bacterium]|nr:hypothetical protein [Actinomycetota bacterium]